MPSTMLLAVDFPPQRGGISRVMEEIARRYPAGSLVVSTGALPRNDRGEAMPELPQEVNRIALAPRRLRVVPGLLFWARRAASLARERDVGFVWCGQLKPAGYVARWTMERAGVPYGLIVYGADLLAVRHRMRRSPLERATVAAVLQSASAIVAVSEWTRDQCLGLMGELGVDASRTPVHVIPLGADPARFRPGIDSSGLKARLGMTVGPWLLTVGANAPHKGVDTVLRAMHGIRARYPDLRYAIASSGRHEEALRRLADAHGVGDRVLFAPDVAESDLPALYNAADIYLGVSRREGRSVEGFGIALAEASASCLPVIAGRSGGIPEMIEDGRTGILVDPERVGPVVDALEWLLDEPDEARRLGTAARQAIVERFNWDRAVTALRAVEESCRSNGARASR